jgi:hypothetical protein
VKPGAAPGAGTLATANVTTNAQNEERRNEERRFNLTPLRFC